MTSRRAWLLGWVGWAALVVVLSGVALEIAVRVRQASRYGNTFDLDAKDTDPETNLDIPRTQEIHADRIHVSVNADHFRSPAIARTHGDDVVRVAFLGGSTTFCAENSSNEATWPELVWHGLETHFPKAHVDYLNAGVPGYVVERSHRRLMHHVKPFAPDVVVVYHATNDLSVDTRALAVAKGLDVDLGHSSLGHTPSMLWDIATLQYRVAQVRRRAVSGEGRLVYDAPALAAGFAERLRALVKDAKTIAPQVVLVTFAHRLRADQPLDVQLESAATALLYMPYMSLEGLHAGYDAYNDAIRRVAAEEGVILIDDADSIPGDGEHFVDSVHFSDAGSREQARRVVDGLARDPRFVAFMNGERRPRG